MKGCDKMTIRGKIVFFISLVILAVVSGIVAYFVTKSIKTPKLQITIIIYRKKLKMSVQKNM